MIKALFFDPITGASGDMILGALLDLGIPLKEVENAIRSTGLREFEIEFNRITDHTGITAGKCSVKIEESHHHRHLSDIEKIIDAGEFSEGINKTARAIFRRLAEAEAKVHNISPEKVHFHEVGAVDAIVDILGSVIAIDYLKPEKIYCAPLKTGRGTVKCAHGEMPVPAPATVELIKGFPAINLPIDMELTTPTGAAILTTLSEGDITGRSFVIKNVGYGIGSRKLEGRINGLRVMEIELDEHSSREMVDIIETDIDDESPEVIAALMD
ncbi:MAG: nickel pincer cofactor biosynthesis protein LarC, partial [candidate division Zixibacteria bacterium]|nr:nickel pincer cofactor biosynthesis protein LarC [candidate division Zixibacteria bacterium]